MTNRFKSILTLPVWLVTPRCHEMTRLISKEKESSNGLVTDLRMRLHFSFCLWCRRYRDHLGLIDGFCREFIDSPHDHNSPALSDEAKARMKVALAEGGTQEG